MKERYATEAEIYRNVCLQRVNFVGHVNAIMHLLESLYGEFPEHREKLSQAMDLLCDIDDTLRSRLPKALLLFDPATLKRPTRSRRKKSSSHRSQRST